VSDVCLEKPAGTQVAAVATINALAAIAPLATKSADFQMNIVSAPASHNLPVLRRLAEPGC
jgi:hypothetical protein